MEQYKTETGRREDLEAMEANPEIGFIGSKIFPVLNVMTKTGTLYYRTLTADAAAQTGRASGTAPNRTLLTDSNDTYTASEVIKRYGVDRDEVKQMGGIASADKLGGIASKRSVERAIEEAIADQVLGNSIGATVDDIEDSLIKTCQTGLDAIRRYKGKTAFVTSYTVFNRIMRFDEVTARFALTSGLSREQVINLIASRPDALKLLLKGILGVDEILVGDDDQWFNSDAAKQERAALVKLPPAEEFSHKLDPVLGKMPLYLPDGEQPYIVESFYDDNDKINNYDASAWYQLKVFNSGAAYILDGLDEGNATTTTTTTTAA